jgi:hypothetical protein
MHAGRATGLRRGCGVGAEQQLAALKVVARD